MEVAAVELVSGQRAGLGEQAADVQRVGVADVQRIGVADVQRIGVADGVGQANALGASVQRGL